MTCDREQAPWHILTGEYPPQLGGVADYTRQVARGLAARGGEVHVWTWPPGAGQGGGGPDPQADTGVTVHRETGRWTRADLARIGGWLDRADRRCRILLQFAPNAFGYKGLNPHLAPWLIGRRQAGDSVRVMFHEVMYFVKPDDGPARRLLAFLQRRLAARLLRAADAVDVNVTLWERLLRPIDPARGRVYGWRPVPSNVPVVDDPEGVATIRGRLAPAPGSPLIGSFGTFAADVSALLAAAMLPLLLGRPDRAAVLIGRGGERVADAWLRDHPELAGRLTATGAREHDEVSRHLQACDLLIQPYPGGVSTKRGSVMAGIAHGVATVTTSGEVTEPEWSEYDAAAMAPEGDGPAMVALAGSLLADPVARASLGEAGRVFYEDRCALIHTLDALSGAGTNPSPAEPARP
jgi:glycosyltransferase involved in cell wall biosynthesis